MAKTAAWQPALNELNCAMGVFKGIFTDSHTSRTGETFETENAYFTVLGLDGKMKTIPVRLPESYHEDNALGQLAKALGFKYKPKYRKTEDGFQILDGDNLDELEEMMFNCEEKTFTFKIERNSRGLWDIKLPTLKPYVKDEKVE